MVQLAAVDAFCMTARPCMVHWKLAGLHEAGVLQMQLCTLLAGESHGHAAHTSLQYFFSLGAGGSLPDLK